MASIIRPSPFVLRQTAISLSTAGLRTAFYSTKAPVATSAILKPLQTKGKLMGAAGFHATARKQILPPLPQVIEGTTNDPAPIPPTSPSHGSYHWTFERIIAAGLIPLTIAPFAGGSLNPVMDAVLCGTLVIHSHIGFQACIIDYFPGYRVPTVKSALKWLLRVCTLAVSVGLYEFETNDVGVTEAIKRIWTA